MSDRPSLAVAVMGSGVVGERVRRESCERPPHRPPRSVGRRRRAVVPGSARADRRVVPVSRGIHVVSTTGALDDVRELLDLDDTARGNGVSLVAGAAVAPGLSGLLARYLARRLHVCDELHIARHGTAGPACAREHHESLARVGPRLARRAVDRASGGQRPRAVLVPGAGRRARSATAASSPTRCCCIAASPTSSGSAPASRRPDVTA